MPEYTDYLGLYKPNRNDNLALDNTLSDNFQKIDDKIQEIASIATQEGETSFYYNNDGAVSIIQTPSSMFTFNYSGDVLDSVVEEKATETVTTSFSYDDDGNVSSITQEVS